MLIVIVDSMYYYVVCILPNDITNSFLGKTVSLRCVFWKDPSQFVGFNIAPAMQYRTDLNG